MQLRGTERSQDDGDGGTMGKMEHSLRVVTWNLWGPTDLPGDPEPAEEPLLEHFKETVGV